jgi:hypothetical protein
MTVESNQFKYLADLVGRGVSVVEAFRMAHKRAEIGEFYGPTLWDDNTSELSTGGIAAGSPTLTVVNGGPYKAYVFTDGDSVNCAFHIKHDVKRDGVFYPHVHWTTDGTNEGTLTWRISHQIAKGHNQAAFPTATTLDITDTASGTAWQHMITEASDAQAISTPEVDSLILMNVELESSSGFGTPADDIFGLFVDLHYQKDRDGTINKAPNFYSNAV